MEPIRVEGIEAVYLFAAINAAVGFVLGLIPLGFGYFRGRTKLGVLGIVSSVLGGALVGLFLSVPAVVLFMWLIIRKGRSAAAHNDETGPGDSTDL